MRGYIMLGIDKFISENAIGLHKNYLENLKLEYSILEKSVPGIKEMSLRDIKKSRNLRYKDEILKTKIDIECHKLFFSSFGNEFQTSDLVKKAYGTEASFRYEMFAETKESGIGGFLIIGIFNGRVFRYAGCNLEEVFIKANPILAIDLCEHAYFLDYGFDRKTYLENAIKYLNLYKIDNFLSCKD